MGEQYFPVRSDEAALDAHPRLAATHDATVDRSPTAESPSTTA